MNEELKDKIYMMKNLYESDKVKWKKEAKDKRHEAEEADAKLSEATDKLIQLKADAKKLGIDI